MEDSHGTIGRRSETDNPKRRLWGICCRNDGERYNFPMSFLRFLMLLALIVWIGGLIFFAFVCALGVFSVADASYGGQSCRPHSGNPALDGYVSPGSFFLAVRFSTAD